jgi:tetratricopeptide (TPR) repeat protein
VQQLRAQLEETSLRLAGEFDRRNGTSRQTDRVRSILDAPDTVHVPLAVPNPLPAPEPDEDINADPVELAYQAHRAYEENDFLTGYRLLKSVPADLDPLLPANLAARLAARRLVVLAPPTQPQDVVEDLAAAVRRLNDVGDLDQAIRFQARLGMLRAEAGDLDAGIEIAERALESAETHSPPTGRILVRLILCELLDHRHEHTHADELLAEALRLAEQAAPERVASVLLESADHEARQGNLDAAERLVVEAMGFPGLRPGDRFHGLRARAAIAEVRGDVELSLAASAELVTFIKQYPGPWVPDVLLHRAQILENLELSGRHLAELVDTVAVCRAESGPGEIARACYLLSSGYLAAGRLVEAAEALEEALRLLPADDVDGTLRIRFRLGSVCAELGEIVEGHRHFEAMLDLVADAPPPSQAMVWGGLGSTTQEPAEAERCHRTAAELWERAELPVEACRAWIKAAASIADDEPESALTSLERAMSQIPPDIELTSRLTSEVLELRGYTYARLERNAEALADNVRAAELVSALGEPDWQIFLMVRAARVHIAMDAAATAEQLAKDSVALISPDTPPSIVARVLDVLSRALESQAKPVQDDTTARLLTARLRD